MTLTIQKLSTHCRSPKGLERLGGVAEDAAHGPFASELRAQLGPSLDRLSPVVRLKELRVKLKIPARNLSTFTLANAWARAFTVALHQALARPPGDGTVCSRHYESEGAYQAALLRHIARNGVASSWEFPELTRWRGHSRSDATLNLLLSQPLSIGEVIAELLRSGSLETVLALFDESALEEIMLAVEKGADRAAALSLAQLVELGYAATATGGLLSKWPVSSRRQAIRLWARTERRLPLRSLWHGLRLLQNFLEMPSLLTSSDRTLLGDAISFPEWSEAVLSQAVHPIPENETSLAARSNLFAALEALRPHVPSAASPRTKRSTSAQWIVSDCAGMLLMLSIARRLDLWRFVRAPEFIKFGGPRALSFFLAGTGMTLLGRWTGLDPPQPAVAIFAGMLERPDLQGMTQFFTLANVEVVQDFVSARDWTEALDAAASEMAHTFASLVRGFRTASRDSIVRQFIRRPGRILVEESRVLVVLAPSPWAVALRLSGMDDRLPGIEWLGCRSIEFVLEGL